MDAVSQLHMRGAHVIRRRPTISDPMIARVSDDPGRRIETYGLGVQQCRAEDIRMMALEPRGGVGDQSERSGMTLREALERVPARQSALGRKNVPDQTLILASQSPRGMAFGANSLRAKSTLTNCRS
jgi:hypothetical protein